MRKGKNTIKQKRKKRKNKKMKNIIFIVVLFCFGFNTYSFSNEVACEKYKKFSVDYMKCKTNSIKNKTVAKSKKFINDTKNFQKKEWSKEKN